MSIDPLTESYEDYTPYQFASNQPVHAQEVEGLESAHDLNKRIQTRETQTVVRDAVKVANNTFKGFSANNSTNNLTTTYKGLHKGDTQAVIFDKAGKNGRGEPLVRFDKAEPKTPYPHVNVKGPLDHSPIPGGEGTLKTISKVGDGLNAINKVAKPVAIATDAIRIGDAMIQDGGVGQNTVETTAKVGGSWAGAYAGSIFGAKAGAAIGLLGGPFAEITVPLGGLIGGIGGGIGGAIGGEAAAGAVIDQVKKPGANGTPTTGQFRQFP